jgi:hypothetical protein
VETFENPQRQVDLDLWFLAGSDISYFLFYFFGWADLSLSSTSTS